MHASCARNLSRGETLRAALETGRRIYAIGDVHGCVDLLDALLQEIGGDLKGWHGDTLLLFLGDYVDRGDNPAAIVERLRLGIGPDDLGCDCRLVCLKGNHEDLFLRAFESSRSLAIWLANGGGETCRSYGIDVDLMMKRGKLYACLPRALRELVPKAHRSFLARLPLYYTAGDYYFCHAGVRPGVGLGEQAEEDLLWIRDAFLQSERDHGKVVVHGHTPAWEPELQANRIGIDTGAVYGGQLTALALEEDRRWFLQV